MSLKITATVGELLSMVKRLEDSGMSQSPHFMQLISSVWELEAVSLPTIVALQRMFGCIEIGEDKRILTFHETRNTKDFQAITIPASFMRRSATTSKS